jgi:hypothetical protein
MLDTIQQCLKEMFMIETNRSREIEIERLLLGLAGYPTSDRRCDDQIDSTRDGSDCKASGTNKSTAQAVVAGPIGAACWQPLPAQARLYW